MRRPPRSRAVPDDLYDAAVEPVDAPPPAARARPTTHSGWLRVALLSVAALAGAIAAVVSVAHVAFLLGETPAAAFDAEIVRLREAGYATTYAELVVPPPAAEDDGMPLFEAAMAQVPELVGEQATWTVPGPWREGCEPGWARTVSAAELADARAFLARLAPVFEKLDAAAAKPRLAWVPVVGADGVDRSTTLSKLVLAQKLLTMRVEAASDPAERLTAVVTEARLGRRIDSYSAMDEVLGLAVVSGAVNVLRVQIESDALPASRARAAIDAELRADALPQLSDAARYLIVQFATDYGILLHGAYPVAKGGGRSASGTWNTPSMSMVIWLRGGPVDCLRMLRALAELPTRSLLETRRGVEAVCATAHDVTNAPAQYGRTLVSKLGRADAVFRLARVALAVAERHEATGVWPASLDDVAGEFPDGLPVDPYTESDFVYELREGEVRIASVGRLPEDPAVDEETLRDLGLVWVLPR